LFFGAMVRLGARKGTKVQGSSRSDDRRGPWL